MAKRLQHRGGTTAQHSTFTGAVREVTVDTDKNTLVVHDGATAGGHPLATATNFTSTGIDDNATSTAITIDSSQNVDVAGTVTADGISLGDSQYAYFGASNDLQIYHDGSNSYIKDVGTGNLTVQGDQYVILRGATGEYLSGSDGASVSIKYNGAEKLATTSTGIDVTGTVVSDGLTVDGNALEVTFSGSTSSTLHLKGDTANSGDVGEEDAVIKLSTDNGGFHHRISALNEAVRVPLQFTHQASGVDNKTLTIAHDGDISFYEDTGTTPKLFWDASTERLGIGTASPTSTLMVQNNETFPIHVKGANDKGILVETTLGETGISLIKLKNSAHEYNIENGRRASTLTFYSSIGGERMCIDGSSGNVGIGRTNPSEKLHVNGSIGINSNTKMISVVANYSSGYTGDHFIFETTGMMSWCFDGVLQVQGAGSSGYGAFIQHIKIVYSRESGALDSGDVYRQGDSVFNTSTLAHGSVGLNPSPGTVGFVEVKNPDGASSEKSYFKITFSRSGQGVGVNTRLMGTVYHSAPDVIPWGLKLYDKDFVLKADLA